jgi:hypothetical protein
MKLNKKPSVSRRLIIEKFEQLRRSPLPNHSIIVTIAMTFGYSIDKNGTNDFVRRVINDHIDESRKAKQQQSHTTV